MKAAAAAAAVRMNSLLLQSDIGIVCDQAGAQVRLESQDRKLSQSQLARLHVAAAAAAAICMYLQVLKAGCMIDRGLLRRRSLCVNLNSSFQYQIPR